MKYIPVSSMYLPMSFGLGWMTSYFLGAFVFDGFMLLGPRKV